MASHTSNSNYFQQLQQDPLEQPRPRHPYAFCQCMGEDCVECLRERIDVLEQALEEKERALQTAQMVAIMALRENQEHREEKLGIVQPLDVGVMLRDRAPRN